MMTRQSVAVIVFALALASQAGLLVAQGGKRSEPDRQAILASPLTMPKANEIIGAMTDMTKYMMSRPDIAEVMAASTRCLLN